MRAKYGELIVGIYGGLVVTVKEVIEHGLDSIDELCEYYMHAQLIGCEREPSLLSSPSQASSSLPLQKQQQRAFVPAWGSWRPSTMEKFHGAKLQRDVSRLELGTHARRHPYEDVVDPSTGGPLRTTELNAATAAAAAATAENPAAQHGEKATEVMAVGQFAFADYIGQSLRLVPLSFPGRTPLAMHG